jgi:hypothetical protein
MRLREETKLDCLAVLPGLSLMVGASRRRCRAGLLTSHAGTDRRVAMANWLGSKACEFSFAPTSPSVRAWITKPSLVTTSPRMAGSEQRVAFRRRATQRGKTTTGRFLRGCIGRCFRRNATNSGIRGRRGNLKRLSSSIATPLEKSVP